jgi:2-polyprenyl-3-methyl-5-hydroxy-6-metoxy-1,4-benzoquinol methylase
MNPLAVERIYPGDTRVKPQTLRHHISRYEFAVAARPITAGDQSLDLGCGSGYGADMLRVAGYKAAGFDVAGEAIEYCKTHFPDCQFNKVDVRDLLKIKIDRPDLVTAFEFIEHLTWRDGLTLIAQVSAVLNPGGFFIVSSPRDINGKYNEFHKSQWGYAELKNQLGSEFRRVRMFGQDWETGKITDDHALDDDFYIAVCEK